MNLSRPIQIGLLAALMLTGSVALAQQGQQPAPAEDHSAHHGGTDQQPSGTQTGDTGGQGMPGMMGQGMTGGCPMMKGMMGKGKGGMMGQMMGADKGALFGTRVTPVMNLSIEDVSGYLSVQLDQLNNKRLKLGEVKSEDGTITADIVTVDNSLVQRLKVNRHTGAIEYQN